MHEAPEGAFTGEISASMLNEIDVHGVVLGHSERREYFNETDAVLAEKLLAARKAGLAAILCVGETEQQRADDQTEAVLTHQLDRGLSLIDAEALAALVIAYEPIWAIGTGAVATAEQAQDACAFIRSRVAAIDAAAAGSVRILYGGSVKADNASELLALPDVDGALVGGASLEPESFAAIVGAVAT
jgi:triosephosphate isomerase